LGILHDVAVATISALLTPPPLPGIAVVNGFSPERGVRTVGVAQDLGSLADSAPDAFVVLSRHASLETGDYRFDIAIRRAAAAGVAAVGVLEPSAASMSPTAHRIADQAGIALVAMPEDTDIGTLCVELARRLAGDSEASLARADRGLDLILEAEQEGSVDAIVHAAGEVLDAAVELTPVRSELAVPIVVPGEADSSLWLAAPPATSEGATRLVLHLAAAAVGRVLTADRRTRDLSERSRTEALTELLAAGPQHSPELVARARAVRLAVDGWHIVARLEVDGDSAHGVEAYERSEVISRLVLQTMRADGGSWSLARAESAYLLVRTYGNDPGPRAPMELTPAVQRAVDRVRERFGDLEVAAGLGGLHSGTTGLRASAAEARAAIGAARVTSRTEEVASFDRVGLHRTLVEWYASDSARESVDALLTPLEQLGPERADTAIHTLKTYLDEQGSTSRTARKLHLHRNAVAYRVQRIFELLEIDPDDPDERLVLQLACRARLLS
jgi:sugar diacid utilization regulator